MPKYRFSITVTLYDPDIYVLNNEGWATGSPIGKIEHKEIAEYIAEAVSFWGGQKAPHDVFFPSNIVRVRVKGKEVDIEIV